MENNNKRLERSRKNRVIAGVCAGLADYFNFDIALMRVLFVVAMFCGGFGFWMYIIFWIVVPEEYTLGPGNQNVNDPFDITPNETKKEEKRPGNGPLIAGLVLVFIGVMALINNFTPIVWIWKLWPIALIMIGVVILINSQKNNNNEQ